MDELGFGALLEAQAGVFTRVQAIAFGLSAREAAPAAASHAEVVFHTLMVQHGITGWEPNVALFLPGYGTVSVDVLFRKEKLVVEIDGWMVHSSRAAFQKDRTRQNALVRAGYRIFRFTWEDLTRRSADCVEQIQQARRASVSDD
ncbi:MAG: endonuclease domain-containing protein [Bifidobacteriaceae bacterium]|jgi:hypothetical protein|nr:endonuclease domain-containing protein [Bifidobacteriaceae bacterium]